MDEEKITSNPDDVELNPLQIEDLYACFRAADNVLLKKYLLQMGNQRRNKNDKRIDFKIAITRRN